MLDILVVCTANQCRSPMAAAILQRRLDQRGTPSRVHSAGLYKGGRRATADAQAIAAAAGLDLSRHRSVMVRPDLVRRAELIIAMAREHARYVMKAERGARPRTFTLKELVRRAEAAGPRPPDSPLGEWLGRLDQGRGGRPWPGEDPADDVDDPIGLGSLAYERTFRELDDLAARLVPLLAPAADPLDRVV